MFEKEYQVGRDIAIQAGKIAMHYHKKNYSVSVKTEDKSPVTQVDYEVNNYIIASLEKNFPNDAILSEEIPDNPKRLDAKRVWCIDPIDGTLEFIAHKENFAIHLGLIMNNRAVFGIVYLPFYQRLLWGSSETGSFIDDRGNISRLSCSSRNEKNFILLKSCYHQHENEYAMQSRINPTRVLSISSVGVKASYVARGVADVFFYQGKGVKEWDTCAPAAIVMGANGVVSNLKGEPLFYNKVNCNHSDGVIFSNQATHSYIIKAFQ